MAEEIASADLNNLYLSSCFFADPEKYRAFCAFYALMRVVDDRVDGLPPRSRLSQSDHQVEHDILQAWEDGVRACYEGRRPDQTTLDRCTHDGASALFDSLMSSLGRFPVPSDLWRDFFSAMHRDIDRPRFGTWKEFLEYARGASVAPTTIYLFLITSRRDSPQGTYRPPRGSDLKTCGYHLGIFAYLGHVVRDLTEDLGSGEEGLLYFSREDMDAFGLTELRLRADVEARRASAQTRDLIAALLGRARTHLSLGRDSLTGVESDLDPDCRFILDLITTIYERVVDKIESCDFDPMADRHRLSRTEKTQIVRAVAGRTGFVLHQGPF